ncbi:hypothetical protein V8C35DRAFT_297857 [Trichoderma chlorosporum]
MLTDGEIESAAQQLASFRADNALPDILDRYTALIESYRRLKSDYEEERYAREKYKQIAKGQERDPFVLVLIDGDGNVFNGNLMSTGIEGGRGAAQLLNEAIKTSLRTKGPDHCQIMVHIWGNLAGLPKAVQRAGFAGVEKRSLAPFVASFNRSYGLFDFVDAGEWKENADFKLRVMLKLYAENSQCKHIYFAACHDVGYISDLTTHIGNHERFTLIAAPCAEFHKEYTQLGMGIEELSGVFHPTPLDASPGYHPPISSSDSTRTAAANYLNNSEAKKRKLCSFYRAGGCKWGKDCIYLHDDSDPNEMN